MIYLNAGNLWDDDYLNTIIRWNEEFRDKIQIKSIFGSPAGLTPTARSSDRLPYLEWPQLEQYVSKAQEHGIAIRYTLNQSCIGSTQDFMALWDNHLKSDIIRLHNKGIREWTITSPLLMELVGGMYPEDFLEVSTIAEVATPRDAERWLALGANGVNLSTSINRNFSAINDIVKTGIKVSILANEACLFGCPWRRECYNLSSHDSWRTEKLFGFYPFRRCNEVRLANPVEWLKSRMVLPQWMKCYQDLVNGVDWFKVAFRTHPKEVALPILRAYMEQQFSGNYCYLWPTISRLGNTLEPKEVTNIPCDELDRQGFLEHFVRCGYLCSEISCKDCEVCENHYRKAINV